MYSSSSTSALQGGGEACSSKQTIVTFDNQASFDSNPSPASLGTFDKSNTIPATHASRDPVQSNPSAVARALSKGITPQHSRNPRVSSHSPLAHSRLHLSTPSHPETWESTCTSRSHGDYSVLPPTPPDDEHVGWNPASQVPLFEKRMNQDICLQMHEAMSMDGSSSGTNSSSPSGRSSNASSSVNGSPTLPTNQMDYRPSIESWLEKGIEAAGEFFFFFFSCLLHIYACPLTLVFFFSVVSAILQPSCRGRQDGFPDASVSAYCRRRGKASNAE